MRKELFFLFSREIAVTRPNFCRESSDQPAIISSTITYAKKMCGSHAQLYRRFFI